MNTIIFSHLFSGQKSKHYSCASCSATSAQIEQKLDGFRRWLWFSPAIIFSYVLFAFGGDRLFGSGGVFGDCIALISFSFLLCVLNKVCSLLAQGEGEAAEADQIDSEVVKADSGSSKLSTISSNRYLVLGMSFFMNLAVQSVLLVSFRTLGALWWMVPSVFGFGCTLVAIYFQNLATGTNMVSAPISDKALSKRLYEIADKAGQPLIELHELSADIDFSDKPVFVAPVNKTHRVCFTKRVLAECDTRELAVLLAHELGHLKFNHLLIRGIVKVVLYTGKWFLIALTLQTFGLTLISASMLLALIATIEMPLRLLIPAIDGYFNRLQERQADQFALNLTRDSDSFRIAFKRLVDMLPGGKIQSKLGDFYATHPSLSSRLAHADRWQRNEGGTCNDLVRVG